MCLDTVDAENRKVKYGYKVYHERDGNLYSEFQSNGTPHIIGKWITDTPYVKNLKTTFWSNGYPSGFHVFTSKKAAKDWWANESEHVIRKVLVKDIVASGTQWGHNVVVCRQKKILPGEVK